jgi:hypothetical protein
MSKYELLRGLYLGEASNADLTSTTTRELLHVSTALDGLIPDQVAAGRHVVLTGNPGDGKSHLVRLLQDRGRLDGARVELDLSATHAGEVSARWLAARKAGAPLVLCANEGPLVELIAELRATSGLEHIAAELQAQLGGLIAARPGDLAPAPVDVALIDLADRSVIDEVLISSALKQVCKYDFLPDCARGFDTSAGVNISTFVESAHAMTRFGRLLAAAGRRAEEHVTFRQLWATIAYALTGGKDPSALVAELARDAGGLGTTPLDNLCRPRAQGPLIQAFRRFADPASFPLPDLDNDLWCAGRPRSGRWEAMEDEHEPPAALWRSGDRAGAMSRFASLKRLVALVHTEGEALIDAVVEGDRALPSRLSDHELLAQVSLGVRRAFVGPGAESDVPEWLTAGLPLWVGLSFRDVAVGERPHVAVASAAEGDMEILRPLRAPWLGEALGPPPELAWLSHAPSGLTLRLDPPLLTTLRALATSDGPCDPPEPVVRFLTRLAGWEEEAAGAAGDDTFAVIDRPRGQLVSAGKVVSPAGEARYV